jgi:anti-sigma regulatory factor (Ser/Thr protein kinase)
LHDAELRLRSRICFEKVAMSTAASVAELMGFPSDRVDNLKTAVAEACLNAIEHGNRFNEILLLGALEVCRTVFRCRLTSVVEAARAAAMQAYLNLITPPRHSHSSASGTVVKGC